MERERKRRSKEKLVQLLLLGWIAGCANDTISNPSGLSGGTCGDGHVDAALGETCDGNCKTSCDDANACTRDSQTGTAATCDLICLNRPVTECQNGDGCCPTSCDKTNDSDCSISCGNGVVDPNEKCDPPASCPAQCNDNQACTKDTLFGSAQNCNAYCTYEPITTCANGDGCCPATCNGQNDSDCTKTYPEGPYGTKTGTTIENFSVEEVLCNGNALSSSQPLKLERYLGNKATMVVVSAGWCPDCAKLAAVLEQSYYQAKKDRGLKILYLLYEDANRKNTREALLAYACPYKASYKMTFDLAVDPKHEITAKYHQAIPLVMLLDANMKIAYKVEEPAPLSQPLLDAVESLLNAP